MAKRTGGFIGQDGINAPDPATGVTGTAGDGQVEVSWTAPSDVGGAAITGYNVQAADGSGTWQAPYYIQDASYDGVSLDVSGQESWPLGIAFNTDGTKLYVIGINSDSVYQYTLSTAFDLSTASYDSVSFSVSTQDSVPYGIAFNTAGTKMYMSGGSSQSVYQYTLSTASDLSTASYDSVSFSTSGQTSPRDVEFNTAGTKMYITGDSNRVYQYTLSTAFDLSTASYDSVNLDVSGQESSIAAGIAFNSDGTKMYLAGFITSSVFQYTLSTAFDLSTASYDSVSFNASDQETRPYDVAFNSDGTKMYIVGTSDSVHQYTTVEVDYPTASPVTVTGLTNGTSYTFNVWAINPFGWSSPSDASGGVSPASSLGIVAGGDDVFGATNVIEYFSIPSTGNATDWGDLLSTGEAFTGGGNATRAIFTGNGSNVMQYITYATAGNALDFGDASRAVGYAGGTASASNTTRMVFVDHNFSSTDDQYGYVTIASTGNATDFGDQIRAKNQLAGMASSAGRGVFSGGRTGSSTFDEIEYITIASTGNGTDFGNLSAAKGKLASCSSATRGVIAGGELSNNTKVNQIEYVTMGSTGNATDFGDLTSVRVDLGAFSSSIRGCWAGGNTASKVNTVDYVTIASTGNSQDFGDLSEARQQMGSTSNVHGGLS